MSLFACSNDDDLKVNEGNKTLVTLTLGKAESRSLIETAEGDNQRNNVNSLRFEFFTADGRNLNVPQPTDINAKITELNSNHTATIAIDNVPLTAYQLVVIANEHASCPINTGTINTALSSNITLESLHDGTATLDFNQQNSVMTGRFVGIGNPATGNESVAVTVNIKPVSSRLQINKFTAEKVLPTGDGQTIANIKSFDVAGIYINQFHVSGAVDPTRNPEGRSKVAHQSTESNYLFSHYRACKVTENAATSHDFSFMCDEYATATNLQDEEFNNSLNYNNKVDSREVSTDNNVWEVVPANNKVWGYPVLAGDESEEEDGSFDVAHIVVRLCNVVYDTDPEVGQPDYLAPRVKYLTITGYKKGGTESVTKFERNNVYVINNLTFDVHNLTDVPYEGDKSISANVIVDAWHAELVTPEIR